MPRLLCGVNVCTSLRNCSRTAGAPVPAPESRTSSPAVNAMAGRISWLSTACMIARCCVLSLFRSCSSAGSMYDAFSSLKKRFEGAED